MEHYTNGIGTSGLNSHMDKTDYDEQECIRWINRILSGISPPIVINDITEPNMCNGVAIGLLLEIMGNLKLSGLLLQPGTRVERLHNVHEVFTMLRRINVRMDNVQPEDVMNGKRQTIVQVILAIASHFSRSTRGRRSVSPDAKYGCSKLCSETSSPRSSFRQTPVDRYPTSRCSSPSSIMPSEHYTELSNARYCHEIIGPNVYTENLSGKSSPRSRSSMTMTFSGQRSPTSQRRSGSRSSEGSETMSSKVRSSRECYNYNSSPVNNHAGALAELTNQRAAEIPHYLESMNELSSLKKQLKSISKLESKRYDPIASDAVGMNSDMQEIQHPAKSKHMDTRRDIHSDLKYAQQQIAELTRILHTKEQALRQKEKEIMRLQETINTLQDALFQQDPKRYGSTGRRKAPGLLSRRYSPDHHSPIDTHDPRVSELSEPVEQPKKRSRSRERMRNSSPGRIVNGSERPLKPAGHHVKRMTFNIDSRSKRDFNEVHSSPVARVHFDTIVKHGP